MGSTAGGAHDHFKDCLSSNAKWAQDTCKVDSNLFPSLAKGQAPPVLWIGCADSRVPETTILGLKPGDVFTHRNIANVINPTDVSMLAIVEFAVNYLKVKEIIVCGHTSCGGVAGSLGNDNLGVIDIWLQPLRALREQHSEELEKLEGTARTTRLAEINVQHGISTLKRIPTVLKAMAERGLKVDGAIYDLATGTLNEVLCPEDEKAAAKRHDVYHKD